MPQLKNVSELGSHAFLLHLPAGFIYGGEASKWNVCSPDPRAGFREDGRFGALPAFLGPLVIRLRRISICCGPIADAPLVASRTEVVTFKELSTTPDPCPTPTNGTVSK